MHGHTALSIDGVAVAALVSTAACAGAARVEPADRQAAAPVMLRRAAATRPGPVLPPLGGVDRGHELITLLNTTAASIDLNGWGWWMPRVAATT
jgi:hypothetical protein